MGPLSSCGLSTTHEPAVHQPTQVATAKAVVSSSRPPEGCDIIRTPIRAPKANAHAERFVGTLRRECLDWLLFVNRRQLERVLRIYVDRYNRHRPHRALDLKAPAPRDVAPTSDPSLSRLERRDLLGGLLHEYALAA
jgi:putative transposase